MKYTTQEKMTYKYLTFLAMFYMTIKLSTVVLIYKIITIGSFTASASTLVIPFWFLTGDIIAEVYGYKIAKNTIWFALICQFIFSFICSGLINFSSPLFFQEQHAYAQVLGKLPRVATASFFAIVIGALANAYFILRWKILLKGKYFWLRSLGASSIGEFIFTFIAYITEFIDVIPFKDIMHLMMVSYVIKILLNPILIIPSSFIANMLKYLEGVDLNHESVNYNPFKSNQNINISEC